MPPHILEGKAVLKDIKESLIPKIQRLPRPPHLCVILVGDNPASQIYVASKKCHATDIGMNVTLKKYPKTISQEDLAQEIMALNATPDYDGLLLQLPLPAHLEAQPLLNLIHPNKDVDGLSVQNLGAILQQNPHTLKPCTPQGVLHLAKLWKQDLTGVNAVVVGCSLLVGKPTAQLLIDADCTVTQAHKETRHLAEHTRRADLLITATGCPHLITPAHVKEGACVIDVGITKVNGKIMGDVNFGAVQSKCSAITPVPGGVGPTTIAYLLKNCYKAALLNHT